MGAPVGNQNAAKSRLFEQAIKAALLRDDRRKLMAIAERLTDMAAEGDVPSIRETIDRVDGKARQEIHGELAIEQRTVPTDEEIAARGAGSPPAP